MLNQRFSSFLWLSPPRLPIYIPCALKESPPTPAKLTPIPPSAPFSLIATPLADLPIQKEAVAYSLGTVVLNRGRFQAKKKKSPVHPSFWAPAFHLSRIKLIKYVSIYSFFVYVLFCAFFFPPTRNPFQLSKRFPDRTVYYLHCFRKRLRGLKQTLSRKPIFKYVADLIRCFLWRETREVLETVNRYCWKVELAIPGLWMVRVTRIRDTSDLGLSIILTVESPSC